jgi:hypothetical protein
MITRNTHDSELKETQASDRKNRNGKNRGQHGLWLLRAFLLQSGAHTTGLEASGSRPNATA